MDLQTRINNFKNFNKNFDKIVKEICQKLEFEITVLNQKQLQEFGVNSDNEKIEPPYAKQTIEYKKKKGAIYTFVTLYDEGDFQNAFYVKYKPQHFEIYSKDKKTKKLTSIYGSNIFGLTEWSLEDLINKVRPLLIEKIREML